MPKNNSRQFTIHEMAELNNLSIDSLRYYEKIGLLSPTRGDNRYRYYTLDDLILLNMIREFRNLNFSFAEIKEIFQNRSLKTTSDLLWHELDIVDKEIAALKKTRKTILQRLDNMNSVFCQITPDTICTVPLPKTKCLHITGNVSSAYELDYYLSDYTRNRHLDLSNIIGRYDLFRLDPDHMISPKQCGIKEALIANNSMKIRPDLILEKGTYLLVTYTGTEFLSGIWVPRLQAYAKEHQLTLIGDFFEFRILDFYDTTVPEECLSAICIKVQE